MSTKFLTILCTETIDEKVPARCLTPVTNSGPWGSPSVYTSSPKVAVSPLRDLVQSPPFRLQRVLNGKDKTIKDLQQQINNLENDKQEKEVSNSLLHKKVHKLADNLAKCQAELKEQKDYRDELESKLMSGDGLMQQQMQRLCKETTQLRTENSKLQESLDKMLDSNEQSSTKNESLQQRHMLVIDERDKLVLEVSTLSRASIENQNLIESQELTLDELRDQLEELQRCLMENRHAVNRTIEESFEGGSPPKFYYPTSPCLGSELHCNMSGENMADAVVDKILGETQEQLYRLQAEYTALQIDHSEATTVRDQHIAQVEGLIKENDGLNAELQTVQGCLGQLRNDHTGLLDQMKKTVEENAHTVANMKNYFNGQTEAMKNDHERKVEEVSSHLALMTGQWEAVVQDKTIVLEELRTTTEAHQATTVEMAEKVSSLTLLVGTKENELAQQLVNFSKQMEIINKERDVYEAKVAEVTTLVQEMETQHAATLSSLKQEAENQQAEFDKSQTDLSCKVESLEFEKRQILTEREQLQTTVTTITEDKQAKENAIGKMAVELKEQQQILAAKEEQMTADISTLQSSLTERTDALEKLQTELDDTQKKYSVEVESLHEAIREKSCAIETIGLEKSEAVQEMNANTLSMSLELSSMRKEKDDNEKLNSELKLKLEEKSQALQRFEEEVQSSHVLQRELEKKQNELQEKSVAQLDSHKAELEQKSSEAIAVKQEMDQVYKDNMALQDSICAKDAQYTKHLEAAKEEVQSVKEECQQMMKEKEELLAVLEGKEQLLGEKKSLGDVILKMEKNQVELQQQNEDDKCAYQKEKAALLEEVKCLQEEISQMAEKMSEGEKAFHEEGETYAKQLADKQLDLEKMQGQLKDMKYKSEEDAISFSQKLKVAEDRQIELENNIKKEKEEHEHKLQKMNEHMKITSDALENLKEEKEVDVIKYKEEIDSLKEKEVDVIKYKEEIDSLKEKEVDVIKYKEEIDSLKEKEVDVIKYKEEIDSLTTTLNEKLEELTHAHTSYENLKCELNKTVLDLKESELTKTTEMQIQFNEESVKVERIKEEMENMKAENESQKKAEMELIVQREASGREEALSRLQAEIVNLKEAADHEKNRALALEAKLIDKEQEVTAAKEEIMRIEREGDKSTRSLTEELQSIKEKSRTDRQSSFEKMKASYKSEVEKLMVQVEEHEQVAKEKEVLHSKYELAKKKVIETINNLKDVKQSNEHYQSQVTKYKDHVGKVNAALQAERAKRGDDAEKLRVQEEANQPLKDRLREAELTIKRLANEKRSLEAQLKLADTKMRGMQTSISRESFGVPSRKSMGPWTESESRLRTQVTTHLTRPSNSSSSSVPEEDISTNDSAAHLIPSKADRNTKRVMAKSVSSDGVFRRPTRQVSGLTRQPKSSADIANLAASATNKKKITPSLETRMADKAVPIQHMQFTCEDEEEQFNNKFFKDLQAGRCNTLDDPHLKRLSELQRRNSLYPPHMRSSYSAEMQFMSLQDFDDDKLRAGNAVEDRKLLDLTEATENLGLDSPAFNLRKRKSLSESTNSGTSLDSSVGKRTKRLSTSYSRPGPPTPGKRGPSRKDKENCSDPNSSSHSVSSLESKIDAQSTHIGASPVSTRQRKRVGRLSGTLGVRTPEAKSNQGRSPSVVSKKGITPKSKKGMTPSSIRKLLSRGRSPWRGTGGDQETPKGLGLGESSGSNSSSKFRIFRKHFGSRNYNVLSASLRSAQESSQDLSDS